LIAEQVFVLNTGVPTMDPSTPVVDYPSFGSALNHVLSTIPKWIHLLRISMNDWLNSLQCLGLVENAAIVRDPRKKQKLNAAPVSSGSHIAALV